MIYDLPPPPIIKTIEELNIKPPKTIPQIITETANQVLQEYLSGEKTPSHNGVVFVAASKNHRCQQNVRQLLESAFGEEWDEASCCARNTRDKMHQKTTDIDKYIEITDIHKVQKGDIVYLGGGGICPDCGKQTGHVMICVDDEEDLIMWQNINGGLCKLPLTQSQSDRFLSAYRFPKKKLILDKPKKIIPEKKEKTIEIKNKEVNEMPKLCFQLFTQMQNIKQNR